MRSVVAIGTATAMLVVGCSGPSVQEPERPRVNPLTSMLLSETEVNAIVAPVALTTTFTYRKLFDLEDRTYSPSECLAVEANTMAEVFQDSGFREVRGMKLDADDESADMDQGVIRFDTPAAARDLVERTVATWHRCADATLTVVDGDPQPWRLHMQPPVTIEGIDVVEVQSEEGYVSTHAMRAVGNVVIDVRASRTGVSEHAVAIVQAIASRNTL